MEDPHQLSGVQVQAQETQPNEVQKVEEPQNVSQFMYPGYSESMPPMPPITNQTPNLEILTPNPNLKRKLSSSEEQTSKKPKANPEKHSFSVENCFLRPDQQSHVQHNTQFGMQPAPINDIPASVYAHASPHLPSISDHSGMQSTLIQQYPSEQIPHHMNQESVLPPQLQFTPHGQVEMPEQRTVQPSHSLFETQTQQTLHKDTEQKYEPSVQQQAKTFSMPPPLQQSYLPDQEFSGSNQQSAHENLPIKSEPTVYTEQPLAQPIEHHTQTPLDSSQSFTQQIHNTIKQEPGQDAPVENPPHLHQPQFDIPSHLPQPTSEGYFDRTMNDPSNQNTSNLPYMPPTTQQSPLFQPVVQQMPSSDNTQREVESADKSPESSSQANSPPTENFNQAPPPTELRGTSEQHPNDTNATDSFNNTMSLPIPSIKQETDSESPQTKEVPKEAMNIHEKLKEMGEISVKPVSKQEAGSSKKKDGENEVSVEIKKKSGDKYDTEDSKRITNLRKNIREVMDENQLDATTLAAQRQESERLARVQEQQKIIRELQRQMAAERQNNRTQNRVMSLLQGQTSIIKSSSTNASNSSSSSSSTSNERITLPGSSTDMYIVKGVASEVTFKGSGFVDVDKISGGNLTPSVSIAPVRRSKSIDQDVEPESDKKEVVTIVDSSSEDDCIVLSDDEDDIEDEPEDDPHNSGLHVNDAYNIPDEQGRVVINIGHPENETDIFVAPQVARIIKPHQIGGVRFLFDNIIESVERFNTSTGFGCILAHSMGLGKTLQLVCFCDIFLRHTDSKSILCIMPINTLQNWVSEFNMWLPEDPDRSPLRAHGEVRPRNFKLFVLNDQHKTLSARSKVILEWARLGGVLLIGYELYRLLSLKLANKKKKGKKNNIEKEKVETEAHKQLMEDIHAALVRPGPDLVICDEGHRIKNSHASISVALKQIRSKRRIVLTGYPLQNNLLEYWCMVDFVRPNYLGTKTEFANMFERPIQNGQCIDSTPQDIKLMRYRAHVLHSLLVGFVQRRSHVVLQNSLPQKEEYVILVRMTSFQRKLYDVFMNEVVRTKAVPNPLKAFAVCCKIWNHPDVLYNFLKKREADLDLELEEVETESNSTSSTTSKGRKKGPAKKAKEVNKDGKTIPSIEVLPNQGKMQIDTVQKVIKEEPNSNDQNSDLSVPKPQNGASAEQNHTMQQQQQQFPVPQPMQQQTQPMSSEQYPPQYPPVQQPNQQQQSQIKEPFSQFQNFQQPPPVPPKEPAIPDPVHGQSLGQQPQQMNYPNQYDNNYNPFNSYGCDNYYNQYGNMYQQPQYGNQSYQSQYTPQNNFWQTDNSNYYGYNQTAQVTPDPYQNDPTYTSTAPKPQEPFDQSSAVSVRQPLQSDEKSSEIVDLDTKEIKTVETNINSIEIPDAKDSKDSKDSKDTKDIKDAKDIKAEVKIENLDDVSVEKEPIKAKEDGIPYDWALELMKGYIPDLLENSPKMVIFFRLLEESLRLGDRILVFSQSLLTLNLIERFLQKNKVPGFDYYWAKNSTYFRLDGSTTAMDREKLINEFNANPQVHLFLVSTRAGSLGINLVGANRVIVFDASWNPCHDTQAVCRVYRYGQRKPCFVYRIVMDNCLEKKIYDRQVNKQGMSDRVVDECNPDAHLSMKEVTNLCYDEEKDEEIKDLSACKDKYLDVVMQKVIEIHHSLLSKEPFHHESLLVDRKEKKLSQAEKRLAQRGYEMEKRAAAKPAYIYNSMGTQYRVMRTPDGAIVHRPVASVRPMQAEMGEKLPHPVRPGGVRPTRWIPAEVWQRQGMTAQEMTLPLDVVIPTSSGDKSNIVLKAGQKVMVLKSPKGIYMQLESGKIIAIRTSLKVGQNKEKPEESEAGSSKASPSSEESLKGSTKVDDSSDSSLSANASDVASPSSGIVKKDDGIDGNTNATQNVKNNISTADNSKSKTQEFSMQGLFKAAASKPMTQSSKQFNVQNLLDTKSSNQQSGNSFGGQNKNASDDVIMVEDANQQPRYTNKQAFSNVIAKGQLGRNFGFNNQMNRQPVNVHGNSASLMANVKPHFNENKNWMGQKSQSQIQNKSVPPTITIDDDCDPPSRDKVVYKPNLVERKTKGSSRAGAQYPMQNFNKTQERQIKPTPSTHQKLAPSTNVKSTDHPVNTSNDTSRQMQNVKPYSRYSFEQGHNISNSASTQQSELPEVKINTRNQKIPTIKNIPSPYPSISTGLGQSSASSTHQSYQQTNPIQTMATSQTSHHSETTSMSSSCPPLPSFSTTTAQPQPHLTPQQDNSATYPAEKQKENKNDKQQSNIDRTIEATAHQVQPPQGQNPVAKEKPDVVENQYQPPTNYNQQLNPATPYVAPQTDPSYMYNRPEHGGYQQPYPGMYSAPVSQSYNYPPQSASSQPTYSYGSYHPHPYDPYGAQNNTAPTYAPPTQTATSNPPSPYHYSGYPPSSPAPPAPDHYNPYYNYPPYPPQTGQWQQ